MKFTIPDGAYYLTPISSEKYQALAIDLVIDNQLVIEPGILLSSQSQSIVSKQIYNPATSTTFVDTENDECLVIKDQYFTRSLIRGDVAIEEFSFPSAYQCLEGELLAQCLGGGLTTLNDYGQRFLYTGAVISILVTLTYFHTHHLCLYRIYKQ